MPSWLQHCKWIVKMVSSQDICIDANSVNGRTQFIHTKGWTFPLTDSCVSVKTKVLNCWSGVWCHRVDRSGLVCDFKTVDSRWRWLLSSRLQQPQTCWLAAFSAVEINRKHMFIPQFCIPPTRALLWKGAAPRTHKDTWSLESFSVFWSEESSLAWRFSASSVAEEKRWIPLLCNPPLPQTLSKSHPSSPPPTPKQPHWGRIWEAEWPSGFFVPRYVDLSRP